MFLPGGIIGGSPPVKAVQFTELTDMITASSVTGLSDGPTGTLSTWVKFNVQTTNSQSLLTLNTTFNVRRNTNTDAFVARRQKLIVSAQSSGGASRISYVGGVTLTIGEWFHLLLSWDCNNSLRHYYYDDVSDGSPDTNTIASGNIDYTGSTNGVGVNTSGNEAAAYDMAEFWFNPTYLDITVEANRRKFITGTGRPAYLGKNGERPTGSSPLLYFKGPASNWGTNSGTGGNFTVTGTFTDTTPPP